MSDISKYRSLSLTLSGILLCLFSTLKCFGQEYYTPVYFGPEDGLNMSTIYTIANDVDGLLWIGGNDGVYRYDGTEFTPFSEIDQATDSEIFQITPDSEGHLFLSSYSGEPSYIYKNELHTIRTDTLLAKMIVNAIPSATANLKTGEYLLPAQYRDQLFAFDLEDGKVEHVMPVELPKEHFASRTMYLNNALYVLTGSTTAWHLFSWTREKGLSPEIEAFDNTESSIFPDNEEYFFLHRHKTLLRYIVTPESEWQLKNKLEIDFSVKGIHPVADACWLTAHEGGAYRFKDGKIDRVLFEHIAINNIFEDVDGNIWFGTDGQGLILLKKSRVRNLTRNTNGYPDRFFRH